MLARPTEVAGHNATCGLLGRRGRACGGSGSALGHVHAGAPGAAAAQLKHGAAGVEPLREVKRQGN